MGGEEGEMMRKGRTMERTDGRREGGGRGGGGRGMVDGKGAGDKYRSCCGVVVWLGEGRCQQRWRVGIDVSGSGAVGGGVGETMRRLTC